MDIGREEREVVGGIKLAKLRSLVPATAMLRQEIIEKRTMHLVFYRNKKYTFTEPGSSIVHSDAKEPPKISEENKFASSKPPKLLVKWLDTR